MKATDTKITTTAHQLQTKGAAQQPFFQKESGDGILANGKSSFFSPSSENDKDQQAFFKKTTPPPFVQAKLTIGQPGDKYEQEADRTADQVVQTLSEDKSQPQTLSESIMPGTISRKPLSITPIQRKCAECEAKEQEEAAPDQESIQMKPIFESNAEPPPENREDGNGSIQRKCSACEQEEQIPKMEVPAEEAVQKKSETDTSSSSPDLESQLSASKGDGNPLPKDTATSMGEAMGADFSRVKVHTGADAVQMNQGLGAQAFTHGNDIYFNEGKYDTGSSGGQHLLAHELTHTVQQGGAPASEQIQRVEGTVEAAPARPADPIDITHRFDPNAAWQAYLEAQTGTQNRNVEVPVKIGSDYQGTISVRRLSRTATENRPGRYRLADNRIGRFYLDASGMEFLNPLRNASVYPVLVLNPFGEEGQTTGFLSIRRGETAVGDVIGLIRGFNEQMEAMRFLGLEPITVPGGGIENRFENGRLVFQVSQMSTVIDGFLQVGGGIGIVGSNFTFNLNTTVEIEGLASGEFTVAREEGGALNGRANIQADIANVNASLLVEYLDGVVTIQGTGRMQSEKFNGEITLLVTDRARSRQMMHAALGVESMEQEAENTDAPAAPKTPQNQVLVGWGEITATITPWLEGTAKVGIDAEGHVTIVGEITVTEEVELMEQRGKKVDLFAVEIRAGYGIPLVGQVFLFASIGMFVNAGFGPLVLRDIRFEGTYSTDPSILQQFSITGTLSLNAFAVLGLEAEAGVGLTLLGHDIKAGVNVTAAAGLRAYALATPTFEYAESQAPEGGKVGEAHLRGHFEAAAQLFLQLAGSLFYELDSPWWSPAPDGREDYPLGEVQYPIGDSMGIGADIDWLVGSPDIPEIEFSPVEFDPEQFTADVMADPPPNRRGNSDESPEGDWQDGTATGNLDENPSATEGGEGIPHGSQQEENLQNLPDEQKYMRGLSEISDIANAREKPTVAVVDSKINRIKRKYGLDQARIQEESDGIAKVFVRHARQDNGDHLVEVPVMSERERTQLLHAAMQELEVQMDRQAGEAGTLTQGQAQSLADAWHSAHSIIEGVRVVDGRDSWDFQVDIGDRDQRLPGKGKTEATEVTQEPGSDANADLDPEEKERRVQEGLAALHQEENQYITNGAISKEEAERVAVSIKARFPVFTSLTVIDGGDTWDFDYTASPGKKEKGKPKDLLPGEGEVDTFGNLNSRRTRGDDLTPHHVPQDRLMLEYGVARNDGISIWMEQPQGGGGRHRRTRSYGRSPDLSETPKDAMENDIKDLRAIYRDDGLYNSTIQNAMRKIRSMNRDNHPNIF